jgi:3-deoxy-D-manno-octulosonate 8-phosphate phosphatase (KDO 8-P phosphatase)
MKIDQNILEKSRQIKLLILDVDGVLTDGKIWFGPEGTEFSEYAEFKSFNCQDGLGLKRLQNLTDINIAVISGRGSHCVKLRLKGLEIKHIHLDCPEKMPVYNMLLKELELAHEHVCYVGDDLPDLPIMKKVGLPVTVNNAFEPMKKHALITTKRNGGDGAVREICELLITVNQ